MPITLSKKPPIGIIPRWLATEHRINDIQRAVREYMCMSREIPIEWIVEYNDLVMWMKGRHKASND